jgi:hypothetical protein
MGSALGPLFTNIFLSFHEKKWLDNCPFVLIAYTYFFRRCVDDSFVLFNSRDHIVPFLDYLNSKHPNIKFTFEIENDDETLSFLDIGIKRVNGNFEINCGLSKTNLYWSFYKFCKFLPTAYKKVFVFSLLFRYFNICSSYQIFHVELEKFKKSLLQNGYPKFFIDRCVKTFLDKMISPPSDCLPYTGNHAIQIRQQLHKLFSSAFPQVQLRVIFKPICRLSNFFHFKDRIPLS